MPDFLTSLALVGVAQIPLLLKLWLEYKSAVGGFKLELYKRQVDLFIKISTNLCRVQENSALLVTLLNEGSLPTDKDDPLRGELFKPYNEANGDLRDLVRDAEVLCPASICVELQQYVTCSVRIWVKAFIPKASSVPHLGFDEIWDDQQKLFNSIMNRLRLLCGTDALSDDTLRQFSSTVANKLTFVVHEYKP